MAESKPPSIDINALIKQELAGLQGLGTKTTDDYLGLPANSGSNESGAYMGAIQAPPPGSTKIPPIWKPGAQNLPLLSNWDKPKIFRLQTQLVAAGLLDEDFREGWWDEASANAFAHVLSDANLTGNPDYEVALQGRINSLPMEIDPKTGQMRRRVGGSKDKTRAPLSLMLSNSDDLADTAQEVAQKRIGRTFTTDELNRFVNSYHSTERGSQTADYANQTPGGAGGAAMQAPSAEGAANTFAEQIDPVAAQARNMLPMVESINQLLNQKDFDTVTPLQGGF